ncbi:hypothetical protein L345_02543, partial [Ophiophagus hannah]
MRGRYHPLFSVIFYLLQLQTDGVISTAAVPQAAWVGLNKPSEIYSCPSFVLHAQPPFLFKSFLKCLGCSPTTKPLCSRIAGMFSLWLFFLAWREREREEGERTSTQEQQLFILASISIVPLSKCIPVLGGGGARGRNAQEQRAPAKNISAKDRKMPRLNAERPLWPWDTHRGLFLYSLGLTWLPRGHLAPHPLLTLTESILSGRPGPLIVKIQTFPHLHCPGSRFHVLFPLLFEGMIKTDIAVGRTLRRHLKWKGHPGGWHVPNLGGLCCSGMEERISSPITAKRGDGFIYNLGWALFIVSSGRAKGAPTEGTVSEQHPELHSLVLEMVSKRRVGERKGPPFMDFSWGIFHGWH